MWIIRAPTAAGSPWFWWRRWCLFRELTYGNLWPKYTCRNLFDKVSMQLCNFIYFSLLILKWLWVTPFIWRLTFTYIACVYFVHLRGSLIKWYGVYVLLLHSFSNKFTLKLQLEKNFNWVLVESTGLKLNCQKSNIYNSYISNLDDHGIGHFINTLKCLKENFLFTSSSEVLPFSFSCVHSVVSLPMPVRQQRIPTCVTF